MSKPDISADLAAINVQGQKLAKMDGDTRSFKDRVLAEVYAFGLKWHFEEESAEALADAYFERQIEPAKGDQNIWLPILKLAFGDFDPVKVVTKKGVHHGKRVWIADKSMTNYAGALRFMQENDWKPHEAPDKIASFKGCLDGMKREDSKKHRTRPAGPDVKKVVAALRGHGIVEGDKPASEPIINAMVLAWGIKKADGTFGFGGYVDNSNEAARRAAAQAGGLILAAQAAEEEAA